MLSETAKMIKINEKIKVVTMNLCAIHAKNQEKWGRDKF